MQYLGQDARIYKCPMHYTSFYRDNLAYSNARHHGHMLDTMFLKGKRRHDEQKQ